MRRVLEWPPPPDSDDPIDPTSDGLPVDALRANCERLESEMDKVIRDMIIGVFLACVAGAVVGIFGTLAVMK